MLKIYNSYPDHLKLDFAFKKNFEYFFLPDYTTYSKIQKILSKVD